jgi:single-stranded-DNA-specific exonuclease
VTSIVLTHGDIDGITSGAIDMLAFPGAEFYFSRPSQIHLDLQRIAKDQPEFVVVSDIAVNAMRTTETLDALRHLSRQSTIYWIDHHPLDASVRKELSSLTDLYHETEPCSAELVYRRFEERLPEHALSLALYGAIADYCDGTPFVIKHLEDFDKRTLGLEAGLLVAALQEIDYRGQARELALQLTLGIEPSSMNDIVDLAIKATRIEHEVYKYVRQNAKKQGQVGYVLDMPVSGFRGKAAKFAATATNSCVGISARSSGDEMDLSIRRRNCGIDLNMTMSKVLPGIEKAQGGGHPSAVGASMNRNDFPVFLERLAEQVQKST